MLEKALAKFIDDEELITYLVQILVCISHKGRVSFQELERLTGDDVAEVLLLADKWRLILPLSTVKTSSWEDRLFQSNSLALYEMPNIVKYMVEKALKTGYWEPDHAILKIFEDMGEREWISMPKLVKKLCKKAKYSVVTAIQIKEVCNELNIGDRVDSLIAELKGSGVISPKLGSIAEVLRAGSPIYEVNPSLCV